MQQQQSSTKRWLWIIPAIPLALMIPLVALIYLLPSADISASAALAIGCLSLLVGFVMLVILLILRLKHKISFSQPGARLSLALAFLDMAIPIGFIVYIFYEVGRHFSH